MRGKFVTRWQMAAANGVHAAIGAHYPHVAAAVPAIAAVIQAAAATETSRHAPQHRLSLQATVGRTAADGSFDATVPHGFVCTLLHVLEASTVMRSAREAKVETPVWDMYMDRWFLLPCGLVAIATCTANSCTNQYSALHYVRRDIASARLRWASEKVPWPDALEVQVEAWSKDVLRKSELPVRVDELLHVCIRQRRTFTYKDTWDFHVDACWNGATDLDALSSLRANAPPYYAVHVQCRNPTEALSSPFTVTALSFALKISDVFIERPLAAVLLHTTSGSPSPNSPCASSASSVSSASDLATTNT